MELEPAVWALSWPLSLGGDGLWAVCERKGLSLRGGVSNPVLAKSDPGRGVSDLSGLLSDVIGKFCYRLSCVEALTSCDVI